MKVKIFILFIASILGSLTGVLQSVLPAQSANEPTGLSNGTLWIYPEYDDPRLLVMLEGQITGATAPAIIRFLVPSAAEMYSAGSKDAQGKYTGGPPDRAPSQISGWDEISYELKTPTFRMEYYDPIINSEVEKHISYNFLTIYPITSLEVVVQVPAAATDFRVLPQGTKTTEGSFTVYTSSYANLSTDQSLHFDISYFKSDPYPSIGGTPVPSTASGSFNSLPILIFAAVIIVAGIIFIAINNARKNRNSKKPSQIRSKFCNQCGKPLEYPSKYCPYCRHKLE
jgi:hypothetical protein